ncbi:MAG: hypothetical protein J5873_01270 [Bacteroidales bacterium]|nr:hypothetical protein [Bacteroidales bacterium]
MKQTVTLIFTFLLLGGVTAQVNRDAFNKQRQQMQEQYAREREGARQQYAEARKKAEAEYAAFRKKANEEYAEAVRKAWQQMGVEPAIPKPKEPEPPRPPAPSPDKQPTTDPLPQAEVVPLPEVKPAVPAPPVPEPPPEVPTLQFSIYGTGCRVHTNTVDLRFKLSSVDEQGVAKAWQTLSQEKYDAMLHDCLAQRDQLHLGDWGYLRLLQSATEQLLGKGSDEAVLLQMYLLTQSGYRVRMAKVDGHLALLVPFSHVIYQYSYISIDGLKHYLLTKCKSQRVQVCQVGFPREQIADIRLAALPALEGNPQAKRSFAAVRFGTLKTEVGVDKSLMEFMNDYPLSSAWECYAYAGLSERVKGDLYPVLRSQIEGKSKKKAAFMLLDFVQTAFVYATDQEQFGYERPLFGDESFFYPKNDCEDRSILYSILVRDLLGLDVALVNWPGHLATAVAFPEEVEGDYFTIEGRRYTVCDPTYIGAGIGETMPQFKNVDAKLVKL